MSPKLSFGKHMGKSFEWLFFKRPSYAQWIYDNDIHRQGHHFDEDDRRYFSELYRRASHLGGVCSRCKERPVARMGLITHVRSGDLGAVGFYCGECEYQGGGRTGYYTPSFFVEEYTLDRADQAMILHEIQRHYIGAGNLTQKKLEAFFHSDANFSGGRKNAFTESVINGGLSQEQI